MPIRRIFLRWMFIAAVVLPLWPLLGWAVFDGGGGGWDFLGLMIAMPALLVVMIIVALVFYGRGSVRRERALDWSDVGILAVWHATIIGFGFFGPGMAAFATAGVVIGLGALWYGIWRLFRDAAERGRAAMAEFERLAAEQQRGFGAQGPGFGPQGPGFGPASGAGPRVSLDGDEDIIVVEERPREEPPRPA